MKLPLRMGKKLDARWAHQSGRAPLRSISDAWQGNKSTLAGGVAPTKGSWTSGSGCQRFCPRLGSQHHARAHTGVATDYKGLFGCPHVVERASQDATGSCLVAWSCPRAWLSTCKRSLRAWLRRNGQIGRSFWAWLARTAV